MALIKTDIALFLSLFLVMNDRHSVTSECGPFMLGIKQSLRGRVIRAKPEQRGERAEEQNSWAAVLASKKNNGLYTALTQRSQTDLLIHIYVDLCSSIVLIQFESKITVAASCFVS